MSFVKTYIVPYLGTAAVLFVAAIVYKQVKPSLPAALTNLLPF